MTSAPKPAPEGVWVIDKPAGMTSHDVVSRVRRALHTRRVGHAGTLDPMATGVLVVMVGPATKLGPYLTAADKRYAATVTFGRATDTLDAEGEVIAEAPLPGWWPEEARTRLEAALEEERARTSQQPPAYSAIKIDGQRAHRLARAGEAPEMPSRPVQVRSLVLEGVEENSASLSLTVAKGYYVRSLARDLGERLGIPAHLTRLRRHASGPLSLDDACPLDEVATTAPLALADAAQRALPMARLTEDGAVRAGHGKRLDDEHFDASPGDGPHAWLRQDGSLAAIGERRDDGHRVLRGFVAS